MTTADVEVTVAGGVQTLRLMRAGKKNALTVAMYEALAGALIAGDRLDDVRCSVILGSGGIFSAGNDIGEFLANAKAGGKTAGDATGKGAESFIRALPTIEKPIIAGVDGPAVGIGTTLLLHCDLVYASPTASFTTPFLDLGLVPEAASSLLAPERMGHARAFELLVLGETFSAERALCAGIVNAVVPAAELETKVATVAAKLAARPPEAVLISKRLMRGRARPDVLARTDEELIAFKQRLASPEALEAFQAFLEKRPPDFAKLSRHAKLSGKG